MRKTDGIPRAPGALPLLGHIPPLLHHPLRFLTGLPALARIEIGPLNAVVVADAQLTQQVLRDDRTFDKGGTLFERLREVVGDGLATCPHSRHRRQRRLTQPAFHPSRIPGYAGAMTARATALRDTWTEGQVLDVKDEMVELTLAVLMDTVFSGTLPPETVRDTVEDVHTLIGGVYRRAIQPPALNRLPTPGNRRYHQATARLRRTVDDIAADRRCTAEDRGDLLSALLHLTDRELSDQAVTFFLGGAETGAIVLSWALYLLSGHPEIEARVHREVDTALADGAPAGLGQLPRLALTTRVVTETLRLYPPAWLLTRTVTEDTELGGHPVGSGTTVVYSPYLVHHDSALYRDPERFDPDRWDPDAAPQPPRHAFIPFGGGARKCIGDRFGTVEAVLALAAITARWRLEPLPGARVRPATGLTLSPRGLRMRVTERLS